MSKNHLKKWDRPENHLIFLFEIYKIICRKGRRTDTQTFSSKHRENGRIKRKQEHSVRVGPLSLQACQGTWAKTKIQYI